ncbi:unnamed protein product, partial [Protopolystoma xenopodis]
IPVPSSATSASGNRSRDEEVVEPNHSWAQPSRTTGSVQTPSGSKAPAGAGLTPATAPPMALGPSPPGQSAGLGDAEFAGRLELDLLPELLHRLTAAATAGGGGGGGGPQAWHSVAEATAKTGLESGRPRRRQLRLCLACRCRAPYLPSGPRAAFNEGAVVVGPPNCLAGCHAAAFAGRPDRRFVGFWLGLWAVLCALSSLATLATFLVHPARFTYPERPIVHLSACYLMLALGYLVRVGLGHEAVACDGAALRRGTTGPAVCSLVFLLTYLFGMAAAVWWVILTVTWFLAAGLKWGSEAISKYSQVPRNIGLPFCPTGQRTRDVVTLFRFMITKFLHTYQLH